MTSRKIPHKSTTWLDDPAFASELDHHRQLLDDWIAKGDAGEGEESKEELAYQAKRSQMGQGREP